MPQFDPRYSGGTFNPAGYTAAGEPIEPWERAAGGSGNPNDPQYMDPAVLQEMIRMMQQEQQLQAPQGQVPAPQPQSMLPIMQGLNPMMQQAQAQTPGQLANLSPAIMQMLQGGNLG